MSIFEIAMLLLFGVSWPFSIYKSWKTRQVGSKSLVFLVCVFAGYLAGITHKILNSRDFVIIFYSLNAALVFTDICLYVRNSRLAKAVLPPLTPGAPVAPGTAPAEVLAAPAPAGPQEGPLA